MSELPIVPAGLLSFLAILGGVVLAPFAIKKVLIMTRSSLVKMFCLGLVILGIAHTGFGIMFGIFSDQELPVEIRQFAVRSILLILFLAFDFWLAIILKWGKTL